MKSSEIKVAVVMLTLNEEPHIKQSIEQFLEYVNYILIVDGGSTDQTLDILTELDDIHEHLNVFWEPKDLKGDIGAVKNWARMLVPKDILWILWVDADEIWDKGLLSNLESYLEWCMREGQVATRFPRINQPNGHNYPDYQVRLFRNSRDIEWRGAVHEVPYYIPENMPLDQMDDTKRTAKLNIVTSEKYPILHLPRRKDLKRGWW